MKNNIMFFLGIAAIAITVTLIVGGAYAEKEMQTDDVQLLILPENQTKFADEAAEYKVNIKIAHVGSTVECQYDSGMPFRISDYEGYEKNFTYKAISNREATTKKFLHTLYCFYVDSTGQKYFWNISKTASVKFVGYPLNFSVEISNETNIKCENPEGIVTGKLTNNGRESISCYYTKIYKGLYENYESKETFSIASPIQSHGSSEIYIQVNLTDIPERINITCWNAHNEGMNVIISVPLNADLSTEKKIDECERTLKILKSIASKESIDVDFKEIETKLSYAKKNEMSKGCLAAERYANECVIMLKNMNETITKKKEEMEKNIALHQQTEILKANASSCIEGLKPKILNLSSLNYGNTTAVYANSAYNMLKAAEKNFADENYKESIFFCHSGEEDVNMALKSYEKEIKEKEEMENAERIRTEEMKKQQQNLTAAEQKQPQPQQPSYLLIAVIGIAALIVIIFALLYVLYRKYKKESEKK